MQHRRSRSSGSATTWLPPERLHRVMWHDPRWSSGDIHGNQLFMQPLWDIAYDGGADLVLSASEHAYERFAPQDANGALDDVYGMREFVVGTGGYYRYALGTRKPNSEVFDDAAHTAWSS